MGVGCQHGTLAYRTAAGINNVTMSLITARHSSLLHLNFYNGLVVDLDNNHTARCVVESTRDAVISCKHSSPKKEIQDYLGDFSRTLLPGNININPTNVANY